MANLSALKDKLAGLKATLIEKTDKIGFIRKWREKSNATSSPEKPSDSYSLAGMYREGSVGTRLQVLAFYVFVLIALVSAGSLLKKLANKMRASDANEQLKKDYSHGFAEVQRKVMEKAEMIALGQFTASVYVGKESKTMSLDLWIRVSDPDTAAMINAKNDIFRDKALDALNEIFAEKVDPLTEAGKELTKEKIRTFLNSALKKGEVEEIYVQNLIVQ